MIISDDKFDALLSKFDALIEQLKLRNTLLGARVLNHDFQKSLEIDLDWKAPELSKKEYLTILGLYRTI